VFFFFFLEKLKYIFLAKGKVGSTDKKPYFNE